MNSIDLEIPILAKIISLNDLYAGNLHWALRKAYASVIKSATKSALRKSEIENVVPSPVYITFEYHFKNPQKLMDSSNMAFTSKVIEDTLKGILIAEDDGRYVLGTLNLAPVRANSYARHPVICNVKLSEELCLRRK